MQDEIMQEVRRVREEMARRNDYDVRKIVEEIQERAAERKASEKARQKKRASAGGSA